MTLLALSRSLSPVRLAHLPRRILAWAELRRSRAALARLDDRLLADVGLTRAEAEAEAEARPPVWDAPSHWRR